MVCSDDFVLQSAAAKFFRGLALPPRPNQRLHVAQIPLERPAARGPQAGLRPCLPPYMAHAPRRRLASRPPTPAASTPFPARAGAKRAGAPARMIRRPMMGTTRPETAPPVTTAAPYSSSHLPGSPFANPAAN